jgi:hypothetical protein
MEDEELVVEVDEEETFEFTKEVIDECLNDVIE